MKCTPAYTESSRSIVGMVSTVLVRRAREVAIRLPCPSPSLQHKVIVLSFSVRTASFAMRRGAVCKLAATALKPAPRATPVLRTHAHPELASTTPTEYIAFPEFVTPNRIEGEEETLEEEGRPHDDGIPWSERTEKRSRAAQTGSSKLGMVELPTDLQLAVNVLVEGRLTVRAFRRGVIDRPPSSWARATLRSSHRSPEWTLPKHELKIDPGCRWR